MSKREEQGHGALIDAIFVARDDGTADFAAEDALTPVVEQTKHAVATLDHGPAQRQLLAIER